MKHFCTYAERRAEMLNNRQRRIEGKLNCLPHPFKRFSAFLPGWLKYYYYLFTANQKVGKTKIVDYLFVYYPILQRIMGNLNIDTHVLYFSFEAGTAEKEYDFYSNLLYNLDNERTCPWDLEAIFKDGRDNLPLINKLDEESHQKFIKEYERTVEYIHDVTNPTGVWKYCKEYAVKNGHQNFVNGKQYDDATGEYYDGKILDKKNPFTWNDPEQYNIIIIDNFANLSLERGFSKSETIEKMSKYCIDLAKMGFVVVAIQHQAQAQEGIENQKLNKVTPSPDGLGDAKTTIRDVNFAISLFSPNRYGIANYKGYDITEFQDNIRFLSVIAGRNMSMASNLTVPLLFRGDCSQFDELPPFKNTVEINKILEQLRQEEKIILEHKQNKNNQ